LLLLSSSTEAEGLEKLSSVDSTPITLQDAQFRIALNSVRQQDFKAALRYLRLVLASDPSNAEAIYNLAAVLSSTGDVEEAAKELRKIERDSPLFVKSRTFAAFLLRQNKDFSGAERAVREALSVEERDPQVLSFLVVILKEGKKFAEARELLETQLDKTPDDGRMLFSYGSLLHEMGDSEGSLVAMERVIALDPINSDALNFVAFALVKKKEDLPRASRLIEDALRIRPNDGYYLDTLGCIQLQQGNPKEAEATLSRAVQLTAEDPEILEHYADALSQNGKGTDALGLYRRALEKLRDADGDDNSAAIARIEDKVSKIVPGSVDTAPAQTVPKKP